MFQPDLQNPVELVWVIVYHYRDIKNPSTVEFLSGFVDGFFEEACDLVCGRVVAEKATANPGPEDRVFVDHSVACFPEWVFWLIDQNPAGVFVHFSAHLFEVSATIERKMAIYIVHRVFVVVGFVEMEEPRSWRVTRPPALHAVRLLRGPNLCSSELNSESRAVGF